jgi:serine protease Do
MDKNSVDQPETKSSDRYNLSIKKPNFNNVKNYQRPAAPSKGIVGLVVICFILSLLGGFLGALAYEHNNRTASLSDSASLKTIASEGNVISRIAKDLGPSVVSVDVTSQQTAQDFFGFLQPLTQQSAGTGFIISGDGVIVTNRHVVAGGTNVTVTLADGTRFTDVQILGQTSSGSSLDVAFLKIKNLNGRKLTPVKVGDSAKMQVGDRVVAIGNALGQFQNTVTSGIISGYGRDVQAGSSSGDSTENLTDLFQTDAAINEGNSGGPLVNINGEVIGLNTAVASNAQNIGFSIPVNDIKGLIASVLSNGTVQQPYLGVRYVSLTADLAYQYNLKVNQGAYVVPSSDNSSVIAGSPADKAGIKEKDIITKLNNTNVDSQHSLTSLLSQHQVGDTVNLTVVRGDKTLQLKATLAATPSGQ